MTIQCQIGELNKIKAQLEGCDGFLNMAYNCLEDLKDDVFFDRTTTKESILIRLDSIMNLIAEGS